MADLACLSAYFIEQQRERPDLIEAAIEENASRKGWLIFATHDICESPSPYGCTPELFEQVVAWSVASGAQVVPVAEALDILRG
jgi:hypothetical protein